MYNAFNFQRHKELVDNFAAGMTIVNCQKLKCPFPLLYILQDCKVKKYIQMQF